jgi:hypothetical protein
MVMELLRGEPLAARLGHGPLPVPDVIGIMARLLSGLTAVHEAGIVHRDLKPENVFLVTEADGTYPKLLDFGVSRALDPTGDLKSVLPTRENAIVGTPQYMSPEQARGLRELDHRSDIWSAGVILFELLTGILPFDAEAVGDVIIQIATAEPPDFAGLRPDLAGPLEQVVRKAMQRDREKRFQTAREMREALLAAAAVTADELESTPAPGRVRAVSELPPVSSQALKSVVGEAYEPGDSGVLDFRAHQFDLAELGEVPDSGLRAVPPGALAPAPVPRDARISKIPTHDSGSTALPASEPPPATPAWIPVLVVILLLVGVGGAAGGYYVLDQAGALADAPPPTTLASSDEEPVRLTLLGVPEGAVVRVDGEPITGTATDLERDGATHALEVETADGRIWTGQHVATADGSYQVELPEPEEVTEPEPEPEVAEGEGEAAPESEPEPAPTAEPRVARPRAGRRATPAARPQAESQPVASPSPRRRRRRATGLMRDPGF